VEEQGQDLKDQIKEILQSQLEEAAIAEKWARAKKATNNDDKHW